MIFDEIKKANIEAMKNKDSVARAFYSVLNSRIMLEKIARRENGKEVTDADISNILQKLIKELGDEKENYLKVGNNEEVKNIERQIELASKYLPKMLSENQIKEIIMSLDDKSVPNVMKHFKANYNGQVDMRKVQEILKGIA